MRWHLVGLITLSTLTFRSVAQQKDPVPYRNFPIVITVQFHSLSYPFRDIRSNFNHVGFSIGTEVALGTGPAWAQQFQVGWYHNKEAGDGILLYTQSAWRPAIGSVFAEIKLGIGYSYTLRPVNAYEFKNDKWVTEGRKGKWMLTLPVGVSLGYNHYSPQTYGVPFASYQVFLNKSYNRDIPFVTNNLLQFGTRIHPNY